MLWSLHEVASRSVRLEHPGQVRLLEQVAKEIFGIASNLAVTLRNYLFGIHGDKLIGTVLLPNAGQTGCPMGKVIN